MILLGELKCLGRAERAGEAASTRPAGCISGLGYMNFELGIPALQIDVGSGIYLDLPTKYERLTPKKSI